MVYKLVNKFEKDGEFAFKAMKAGRPRLKINSNFAEKVKIIRNKTGYGSEKIQFTFKQQGFAVSEHIVQRILDQEQLTKPNLKLRKQRKYVRYQWPISNYMWHTDWTTYNEKQYCAFLDDRSRKIMAAGVFKNATTENTLLLLYQAIMTNEVCPAVILSDKGAQFYANKYNRKGEKGISVFEAELQNLGITFWTSRTHHPQTNGKMEKWFDTMKKNLHRFFNLNEFVKWYNEERIHHALKYKTPEMVYNENL